MFGVYIAGGLLLKGVVVFDSKYGNTEIVAEEIREILILRDSTIKGNLNTEGTTQKEIVQ